MPRPRAFVVMQIGVADSPERKRADEIYEYIVQPALAQFDVEAYRADLDPTPGAITPRILSELVGASLVVADLTGRNPNVFYEVGISHSFAKPLISLADSARSLPFDAKDERVIELGEYAAAGLTYVQGEKAKAALIESLRVVLADGYIPPSPLKDVAANRSVDQLAPANPLAAEMAQMRETLEEIRKRLASPRGIPVSIRADLGALRAVVERNVMALDREDFQMLVTELTSQAQSAWAAKLEESWRERQSDPWGSPPPRDDPWGTPPSKEAEPPF